MNFKYLKFSNNYLNFKISTLIYELKKKFNSFSADCSN